jgi:predicted MPP superfamily phosphohydrolase
LSLFLLTFFLVYGGTHAYAFRKAQAALGFGWTAALGVIPVLSALCCAPLIVHVLGKHGYENASRAVSWVGYVWMGLLFFFFCSNLAVDALDLLARVLRKIFGKAPIPPIPNGRSLFYGLAAFSVALGAYSFLEASRIGVERVRISTGKLPLSVSRLRIVQISDVHLGLIVRNRTAAVIAEAIRREKPDIVVSTGDLVDARINHLDGLSEIFASLRPPLGKYAVTGNHEFYAGIGPALDFTRRAGFTVLRGEIAIPGNVLRIVGVDDPQSSSFGGALGKTEEELFAGADPGLYTVLLKHRPVLSPGSLGRFDLQLSGHTHSGQIFPFRLLTRLHYPLVSGLHAVGGEGILYTSRGTGTWGPPMRFLSPPEVTVFDIQRDSGR